MRAKTAILSEREMGFIRSGLSFTASLLRQSDLTVWVSPRHHQVIGLMVHAERQHAEKAERARLVASVGRSIKDSPLSMSAAASTWSNMNKVM